MKTIFAATLLALLPVCALAVETDSSVTTYTNTDWDFSLSLPDNGLVTDASSEEWEYEDPTVFAWVSLEEDSPVFLILGSAMLLDTDATDQDVADFISGLTDEQNNKDNNVEVEEVSDVFTVGTRGWVSVLFADNNEASSGEFEVFVTRQGPYIYAVALHYLENMKDADTIAEDVLASFVTSGG